ncbi:MAG: ATP-binding protein [Magnetospirillum sp.]|nr:ATP-binding protein [Magnetospirillum sp.]
MLRKINADQALTIAVECHPDARFAGDRDDLAEMLGNLMDNACKWARSQVRVSAGTGPSLAVTVEDDGPGLTEAQQAEATRRGARLDENAPGHGLGLAIVGDLAALYGGRLALHRSSLGGLAARLEFHQKV